VKIELWAGERSKAADNLLLGTFELAGIEPALHGVPQIQLKAIVDPSLVMVVTAEDLKSGRKEVLDAVDLSQVQVPPAAMVPDPAPQPKTSDFSGFDFSEFFADKAAPDTKPTGSNAGFRDIFSQFFGRNPTADQETTGGDTNMELAISRSEAESGVEKVIDSPEGQKLRVKIPAKVKSGSRLRLQGQGREHPCGTCRGTGSTDQAGGICSQCGGKGQVTQKAGAMNFNLTCPRCNGTGKPGKSCSACGGNGKVRGDLYLDVTLTS